MTRPKGCTVLAAMLLTLGVASAARAADEVLGSFTVQGRTTALRYVYASIEQDPSDQAQEWLVLLLASRVVEPPDRTPARLLEASRKAEVQAVRVLWTIGGDRVLAVPYHQAIRDSGRIALERPTLDLQRLDEDRVELQVASKRLGQAWHYNARLKATPHKGRIAEIEPELEATDVEAPADAPGPGGDPRALKVALGRLDYEADEESFTRAVKDGAVDAVRLFLDLGMSPNVKDDAGNHLMIIASMFCAYPPPEARETVLIALVQAKGDVNAKDQNDSTPLIWAVQSCTPAAVRALVDAGADVNAKARGGATPMMMATVFNKTEIVDILKAAGAR